MDFWAGLDRNDPATGGGGITILFYDWDDSLIGSLIVDGGDVRAQVEDYVEKNLVHPDLLPSKALAAMGGKLPDYSTVTPTAGSPEETYQNLATSLKREYTYRGKYAYTVGGNDAALGVTNGEDYPLTNKLDYVFTKRVNTSAAYTVDGHTETYVLPHKLTDADMVDAALYPYTYGWAVVEDASTKNKTGWKVMNDAKKIEDTWTTIGVGELFPLCGLFRHRCGADTVHAKGRHAQGHPDRQGGLRARGQQREKKGGTNLKKILNTAQILIGTNFDKIVLCFKLIQVLVDLAECIVSILLGADSDKIVCFLKLILTLADLAECITEILD